MANIGALAASSGLTMFSGLAGVGLKYRLSFGALAKSITTGSIG